MNGRNITVILLSLLASASANCRRIKEWQYPNPANANQQNYKVKGVEWETTEENDVKLTIFLINENGEVESKPCGTYGPETLMPGEDGWMLAKCGKGERIGKGAKLVADGAGVKYCSKENKLYLKGSIHCGMGFVNNGGVCVKAPTPAPPDWRPRDDECVMMESSMDHRDDHRTSVTCGYDRVLASCKCQPLDAGKGFCDGVTISGHGKTCNAWGAKRGGDFKAIACCKKPKGTIVLVSKPQSMMSEERPPGGSGSGASVDCPAGSKVITCTHHTLWGNQDIQTNLARNVKVTGNRCQATSCSRCNVQAVCEVVEEDKNECKGSLWQIDGNDNSGDDRVSEATCPDDTVLKSCRCLKVSTKNCDGATVSGDGKTCYAHGGTRGSFRARGCCVKRSGSVITISNPWVMEDMRRSSRDKNRKYLDSPIATCPEGYTVVFCAVHTYESGNWRGLSGRKTAKDCKAADACNKCGVQAVCAKAKGSGNAVYELRGSWVHEDDRNSATTCPRALGTSVGIKFSDFEASGGLSASTYDSRDHVLSSCECVIKQAGKYCDGVTTSADGRTCNAWGSHSGGDGVRAKATCKKRKGQISVVSKPQNIINAGKYRAVKGPTVDCPKGSSIVLCLVHSYYSHKSRYRNGARNPTKSGRRCSVGSDCRSCGISAICESEKAAPTKCIYEVESREESGDNRVTTAVCPRGTAVTKCECISTETNGHCDGALVDGSGLKCVAHGGDRRRFKARACCGLADRGNILVVSNPPQITDLSRSSWDKNRRYMDSPIATCPAGYKAWYCQVHTYKYKNWRALKVKMEEGKRCHSHINCNKCSVQAVCAKPYH